MRVTFLGTGTSHGVPPIDCIASNYSRCAKGVCRESVTDKKHRRTRSSIILEHEGWHILIDVSSDFRQQALREHIPKIDAVLITHIHADHIMGIPDIRSYTHSRNNPLPFYGSKESIEGIQKTFSYIFDPDTFVGGGIPQISCHDILAPFSLFNLSVTPVPVKHGSLTGCFGFRINNCAYIPDLKALDASAKKLLTGLDCLIIDCLREEREHSTHIILPESLAIARDLQPKKCYFTHLCHLIHYKNDASKLDSWIEFAWDGLSIEV